MKSNCKELVEEKILYIFDDLLDDCSINNIIDYVYKGIEYLLENCLHNEMTIENINKNVVFERDVENPNVFKVYVRGWSSEAISVGLHKGGR